MVERLSVRVGSEEIHFETGKIAKQAHGSVMAVFGDTMVLSAVCVAPEASPGQDFFPLTVDYREKSFAAGRIPGNFFRREGRPTEREILVCRLTDRPVRPLFPKGFFNELQVCQTVFSADNEHDPGVLSINAASAALSVSPVPFLGPIGAVRVGCFNGEFEVNPPMSKMAESQLDLVLAGTREAICMVEGSAKELPEDKMVEALEFGHTFIIEICKGIEELQTRAGVPKMPFVPKELDPAVVADVEEAIAGRLEAALSLVQKQERQAAVDGLKAEVADALAEQYGPDLFAERAGAIAEAFTAAEKKLMRQKAIRDKIRLDGRRPDEIRPITIEVGILPRTHGSCLFTRGETQAIVTTTLGTSRDEQRLDELTGEEFKRFMLHYNFPSWSVGEVRRISGPGRREVGHGKLTERALECVLPNDNDDPEKAFPYVIRVVSDITESNGSSSMASVCGGTMSMMDAGVPIKAPVAGIAMGLIKEGDDVCVLTDILGAEDHYGDMDFKVCGTAKGITAFQMDTKIGGIPREVMHRALMQARDGRLYILDKMLACLPEPRKEISPYAPRIYTISIPVDKIREVIGPGGKVIREIQTKTGAEIEIEDDGTVNVAAVDKACAEAAIDMIKLIVSEVEVGKVYHGTVTRIMNFGAFVSVLGGREGLVHISELAPHRVGEVTDVVQIGDEIDVKVIEIDRMGRVNMSKNAADLELGRISAEDMPPPREPRSRGDRDRGGRGGDRGGRGGDRGGHSDRNRDRNGGRRR
ncbi:MAG TPA: polyribonucleotide nucleotidyltransferase [Candidatus Hydrogenedentes bacterium]|nr:polyribonucleotide nucleotidyltransferase [Candidatus Hydrogenedentota bacterium]HRT19985.1 polyribonucleotide nucleotidyltransferase [Candidatus Hydrogenedentota bacterium]HRT64663.1 polyribonucleotide nucleotidyltransferase [Candidatus Hydrogenedentota bacterium]